MLPAFGVSVMLNLLTGLRWQQKYKTPIVSPKANYKDHDFPSLAAAVFSPPSTAQRRADKEYPHGTFVVRPLTP